jgi:hypothetical protein
MSMPGFTADLSVYKTSQHYRTGSTFSQANSAGIRPAQLFDFWRTRPILSPDRICGIYRMYCDAGHQWACDAYQSRCT